MESWSGRSFVKAIDHTPEELTYLLDLSTELKDAKRAEVEQPLLAGKNIALIFEKTSTRTRAAFEVAAYDQGAHVTYLDPSGSQMGHKESIPDTARVLGRMYDAIEYWGSGQENVQGCRPRRCPCLQRPHKRMASNSDARRLPHDA